MMRYRLLSFVLALELSQVAVVPALAVTTESRAHVVKGIELYQHGNVAAAISEFRKATELDPTNADYHNNLSAALKAAGKIDEALKEAKLSVKYRPSSSV